MRLAHDIDEVPLFDRMAQYDKPTFSYLVNPTNGDLLAAANLHRMVLMFSVISGGPIVITTEQIGAMNQGIYLQQTTLPFQLFQQDHGNLAQIAWYCSSTTVVSINIIEVILRGLPEVPCHPLDGGGYNREREASAVTADSQSGKGSGVPYRINAAGIFFPVVPTI
jgi:hypothetical protein